MAESYIEVVTRYGGHRHLARTADFRGFRFRGHWMTECRFVSAWTIQHWAETPDHPLGLTPDTMAELPACPACMEAHPEAYSDHDYNAWMIEQAVATLRAQLTVTVALGGRILDVQVSVATTAPSAALITVNLKEAP